MSLSVSSWTVPYQRLCGLGEVSPGTARELPFGGITIALCNVSGGLHAVNGRCPHRGGPVGQGVLNGTHLTCPWHSWTFDVTTGACLTTPGTTLKTYPVHIEGESVLVELT